MSSHEYLCDKHRVHLEDEWTRTICSLCDDDLKSQISDLTQQNTLLQKQVAEFHGRLDWTIMTLKRIQTLGDDSDVIQKTVTKTLFQLSGHKGTKIGT
jgi:hypothetical protein